MATIARPIPDGWKKVDQYHMVLDWRATVCKTFHGGRMKWSAFVKRPGKDFFDLVFHGWDDEGGYEGAIAVAEHEALPKIQEAA